MGANVGQTHIAEGNTVAAGDTLMVLECMKMEFPVLASAHGTVQSLKVAPGDAVEEGALLAVLAG